MNRCLIPPVNFAMVEEDLFRSGEPREFNFPFVEQLNIKSILYLGDDEPSFAFSSFAKDQRIKLLYLGKEETKTRRTLRPMSEDIVITALNAILSSEHYPLMVCGPVGKHRVGIVIGCLRKIQRWNISSIFHEYRRYAGGKVRTSNEQFIELFDTDLVATPQYPAPWLDVGSQTSSTTLSRRSHPTQNLQRRQAAWRTMTPGTDTNTANNEIGGEVGGEVELGIGVLTYERLGQGGVAHEPRSNLHPHNSGGGPKQFHLAASNTSTPSSASGAVSSLGKGSDIGYMNNTAHDLTLGRRPYSTSARFRGKEVYRDWKDLNRPPQNSHHLPSHSHSPSPYQSNGAIPQQAQATLSRNSSNDSLNRLTSTSNTTTPTSNTKKSYGITMSQLEIPPPSMMVTSTSVPHFYSGRSSAASSLASSRTNSPSQQIF